VQSVVAAVDPLQLCGGAPFTSGGRQHTVAGSWPAGVVTAQVGDEGIAPPEQENASTVEPRHAAHDVAASTMQPASPVPASTWPPSTLAPPPSSPDIDELVAVEELLDVPPEPPAPHTHAPKLAPSAAHAWPP
jgi:hypothetical protein